MGYGPLAVHLIAMGPPNHKNQSKQLSPEPMKTCIFRSIFAVASEIKMAVHQTLFIDWNIKI
jgi:hypothetical protein